MKTEQNSSAAAGPIERRVMPHEPMTVLDYQDDGALRFVQRVLEGKASAADRMTARNMIVAIRARLRNSAT